MPTGAARVSSLASETLDLRPGVHVLRWLASEPGAWRGGAYAHAKFAPEQVNGEWRLVRSRGPPVFVAVKRGNILWYGELILSFRAAYRPGADRANDAPLCLVRWLQPIAVVAQVEGQRALTAAEAMRCSCILSSLEKIGTARTLAFGRCSIVASLDGAFLC